VLARLSDVAGQLSFVAISKRSRIWRTGFPVPLGLLIFLEGLVDELSCRECALRPWVVCSHVCFSSSDERSVATSQNWLDGWTWVLELSPALLKVLALFVPTAAVAADVRRRRP
jgi:hypothetical protein